MNKLIKLADKYKLGKIEKQNYISEMYENFHSIFFEYQDYIINTNIKKITITDKTVTMITRNRNIKLVCTKLDKRNHPFEILNFSDVEKNEINIMNELLPPNATIFDIGANIGFHSLNLSITDNSRDIYAFEPAPETFNILKKNVFLNKQKKIKVFNFGFSNFNGISSFFYNKTLSGNSSLKKLIPSNHIQEIFCEFYTLDSFVKTNKFSKIDFIKCDVEGAELLVISGGIRTIKKFKPIIFAEILRKFSKKFMYDPNEIFSLLRDLNYCSYAVDKNGNLYKFSSMNKKTLNTNFFFLHKIKHKQLIASLA